MKTIGSIQKIEVILSDNLYAISKPDENLQVSLTLFPGYDFVKVPIQSLSAKFTETEKTSKSGILVNQELIFTIIGLDMYSGTFLHAYKNRGLIFLITDANNNCYVLGSKINPAFILVKNQISPKPENPNKYKVTVKRKSDIQSYYLLESFTFDE